MKQAARVCTPCARVCALATRCVRTSNTGTWSCISLTQSAESAKRMAHTTMLPIPESHSALTNFMVAGCVTI